MNQVLKLLSCTHFISPLKKKAVIYSIYESLLPGGVPIKNEHKN